MGLLSVGRRGSLNSVPLLGSLPSVCFLQLQCVRVCFVILFYYHLLKACRFSNERQKGGKFG